MIAAALLISNALMLGAIAYLILRSSPMASQAFTDVLTNLIAAKDAQAAKMVSDATAAANAQIADLQTQLADAQNAAAAVESADIKAVQDQIDALNPPPAGDQPTA